MAIESELEKGKNIDFPGASAGRSDAVKRRPRRKTAEEDPPQKIGWHNHLLEGNKLDHAPFDSSDQLRIIERVRADAKGNSNLERRLAIQKRLLEKYKENLISQKRGIAEIQMLLEQKIRQNPDAGYQHLRDIIQNNANEFRLTERQIERLERGVQEYMHKHGAVDQCRKKYPDDRDLFEACFNRRPEGAVEVIKGPMTLYFRCYNLRDYAHIYHEDFSEASEIDEEQIRKADKSGGVSVAKCAISDLESCIIAEKSKGGAVNKKTLEHEEFHAIKRLFGEDQYPKDIFDKVAEAKPDKKEEALRNSLRKKRREFEERAKGEFLAYLKEGIDQFETTKELLKGRGSLYDYYGKWYEKKGKKLLDDLKKVGMDEDMVKKIFEEVFVKEYVHVITQAKYAMSDLENEWHMSDEEIINLLINEPLRKWPKLVSRLRVLDVDYDKEAETDLLQYFREGMDLYAIEIRLEKQEPDHQKFLRFKKATFRALEYLSENKFARREIVRMLEGKPADEWDAIAKKAVEKKNSERRDK